jgi:Tol biopolymer transport system component
MSITEQQLRDALRARAGDVRDVVVRMPDLDAAPRAASARTWRRPAMTAAASFVLVVAILGGLVAWMSDGSQRAEPASPAGPCAGAAAQVGVPVGGDRIRQQFVVLNEDCTSAEVVSREGASVYQPALGPAGDLVYVTAVDDDHYSLDYDSAARDLDVVLATSEMPIGDPTLSPDGRSVAYWKEVGDGHAQIWVQSLEDGAADAVSIADTAQGQPSWSPDSRRLVVTRADSRGSVLVIVDAAAGRDSYLPAPWGFSYVNGAWSPDGTRLVAVRGPARTRLGEPAQTEIVVLDASTGDVLEALPRDGIAHDVTWDETGIRMSTSLDDASRSVVQSYSDDLELIGTSPAVDGVIGFG